MLDRCASAPGLRCRGHRRSVPRPWSTRDDAAAQGGLTLKACIGRGAHGMVFEGETFDGRAVAVKITPVHEPHNVNELAAGDLVTHVQSCEGRVLDEAQARHVFSQVVAGLVHCHSQGVWHLDVKPDNILIAGFEDVKYSPPRSSNSSTATTIPTATTTTSESSAASPRSGLKGDGTGGSRGAGSGCAAPDIKITDFGCAATAQWTTQPCGTVDYACPEALAHLKHPGHWDPRHPCTATVTIDGDKADVWATGITLATCILGYFPWAYAHPRDAAFLHWCSSWSHLLAHRAAQGVAPAASLLPDEAAALFDVLRHCCGGDASPGASVSPMLAHLLVTMLDPRPQDRPGMREVAAHPWLQSRRCGPPVPTLLTGRLAPSMSGCSPAEKKGPSTSSPESPDGLGRGGSP